MDEELDYSAFAPAAPEEELDYSAFAPAAAQPKGEAEEELDYSAFAPAAQATPDQEYEGFSQELFEGIISGVTKVPQGIAETATTLYDLAADTDTTSEVTQAAEDFRAFLGVDPKGLAGTVPEVITQFVVPGGLAAKAVGSVGKAGKLGKFAKQLAAAGVVDAAVSTDDTTTLGDFFEGGPTQQADLIGLEGREKAAARLVDDIKIGVEGSLGVVAAPFISRAATAGASGAATAIGQIPGATQAARVAQSAGQKIAQQARKLEKARVAGEQVGPVRAALADTLATLRPRGYLPQAVAEPRSMVTGEADSALRQALRIATNADKKIQEAVDKTVKASAPGSPLTRAEVLNSLDGFLSATEKGQAEKALSALPKAVRPLAQDMRKQIDDLSNSILKSEFVSENVAEETIRKIQGGLGNYMRRRYRVFEDAAYTPDEQTLELAFRGFKNDPAAVQNELALLVQTGKKTADEVGLSQDLKLIGQVTDEQARLARDEFLYKYDLKNPKNRNAKGLTKPRAPEYRLQSRFFKDRVELRDYQKALMGEIKNPVEAFVATVADLSEFKAADDYYKKIADLSKTNPGVAALFRDTAQMSDPELNRLTNEGGFVLLGGKRGDLATKAGRQAAVESGWGSLYGYAVPERVYKDLSRVVVGDTNIVGNAARSLYSTFLKAKGVSQYSTVVLSPPTQIRNATSGGLYAAMQGNVGRGASLMDSMRLVYNDLKGLPDEELAKLGDEMTEFGLFGSQAEAREMRDLVGKGLGFTEDTVVNGLPVGRKFGAKLTDNYVLGALAKVGKKAEATYQGGDDFWKYYNFVFEEQKLRNAFKNKTLEQQRDWLVKNSPTVNAAEATEESVRRLMREEAARIVRNNVPNYNVAPEAVRGARKLPVGNFISFQYETFRTAGNTIARGIKELADPDVEIQKIGLRRLMGTLTTAAMLGPALSALGNQLTKDGSEEEMEAYKRSLAMPWERNARLVRAGEHEDGTPRFVNYSFTNPYDPLERVVVGALNAYNDGKLQGKSPDQLVFEAGSEALYELFAPFTEESMVTEALRDVLDPETKKFGARQLAQLVGGRGGKTKFGAQIYSPQATAGEKLGRSFVHVADVLLPTAVPISGRGGDIEPSRFARGFINALNLNETLGIDEKDRQDRERQLSQELARVFSGVSETESQIKTALTYKGYEFARDRSEASRIFGSVARRPNVQADELLDAYQRASEARFRVFQRFNQVLRDAETLGLSRQQARRILREADISGVNEVVRGQFKPLDISDSALDNLRRNRRISELPRREINRIKQEQRRRDFVPMAPPDLPETDSGAEPVPENTEASIPPTGAELIPAAALPQQAQAAPASAPQPETRQAPSPELLGGNLFDRIRNMELFNTLYNDE